MEDIRKKKSTNPYRNEIVCNKLKHLSTITDKLKNEVNIIISKSSQLHESVAVQRTQVKKKY